MVNVRTLALMLAAACGGSAAVQDTTPQPAAEPAAAPPPVEASYPPPPPPPPIRPMRPIERCERWRGTVTGNDPTVTILATLCRTGNAVRGELIWLSRNSGRSERAIEGRWSMGQLVMRDVDMRGRPRPGWQFCMIDRYALSAAGDRLAGTYHSSVCRDDATISLVRER